VTRSARLGTLFGVTTVWPLVGREEELTRVAGLLRAGDARGVLLAGPSGVGKSRLAEEGARALGDAPVVRVRGTRAAAAIPLGAFATLLPPDVADVADDAARLRLAAQAVLDGGGVAPGRQVVLFADDVHSLDEASAALLLAIALSGRAQVIATLRTGEPASDAVTSLWKDELLTRIDLEPLSAPQVVTLLESVLGGPLDGMSAVALHRASGGNPLFLRELVAGLTADGTLAEVDGLWCLLGAITAPPRLAELVEARLAGVRGLEQLVLQAVALLEPLGLRQVEHLGWGDAAERLERLGLVDIATSGRRAQLRMAHPVYTDVVRQQTSARRRREILHGAMRQVHEGYRATVIGAPGRRREDALRHSAWRLETGEPGDPESLLAAARLARGGDDITTAERFARAAVDAGGGPVAAHMLGRCLDLLGRHDEADDVYARAATADLDDDARALLALGRSENLFRGLGRPVDAYEVLDEAEGRCRDPLLRHELTASRAMFVLFQGRVADVFAVAGRLVDAPSDDRSYCQAALQVAMAMLLGGRVRDAIDVSRRAFEVRVGISADAELSHPGVFLVAHALALAEDGRIADAIATARIGYAGATESGNRDGQAWFSTALCRALLYSGELQHAARAAREVVLAFGRKGHPGARWGYAGLAQAYGQEGDANRAADAVADLDAEAPTPLTMLDAELELGRAWAACARGELALARALAVGAADHAARLGQHALELHALHMAARLGGAAEVLERAGECAARVDGGLAPMRLAFVEGVARRAAGTLEEAAEGLEELGAHLWAAEAWNEAAVVRRAAGDARRAQAAAQRSHALAARCDGPATPLLRQGTDVAVLTRREREIAALAAHGLSNRDIADQLVVSLRTVENHLQRAYEKLGINRREQLAGALERAEY
jgi:DNA-binding CsgD family transcriptional regulator